VFITKGPYWAIGSFSGRPATRMARAPSAGLQHHAVAARGVGQDGHALAAHGGAADGQLAAVDVDKGVVGGRQRLLEGGAGFQVQVQVQRLGGSRCMAPAHRGSHRRSPAR
jgi:hypothetical protein